MVGIRRKGVATTLANLSSSKARAGIGIRYMSINIKHYLKYFLVFFFLKESVVNKLINNLYNYKGCKQKLFYTEEIKCKPFQKISLQRKIKVIRYIYKRKEEKADYKNLSTSFFFGRKEKKDHKSQIYICRSSAM